MTGFTPWFIALCAVLFTLDGVLTGYAFVHRSVEEENRFLRWLFGRFGFRIVLVLVKIASLALAVLYAGDLKFDVQIAVLVGYIFVVAWSLSEIEGYLG